MSENRFTINLEDECIDDAEERIFISFLDRVDFYELCAFLNEQQTEITELREAIDYLKTVIRYTIPNQMVADVFKYIGEDYE